MSAAARSTERGARPLSEGHGVAEGTAGRGWLAAWQHWHPRLRTRLLANFVALVAAALALAAVGMWGMQRTQAELRSYDIEVLPQIARSLEIAERISRLAATAPNLADARSAETLQANAEVARSLLDQIRREAAHADARGRLAARMQPLIERGQGDFGQLTELAQQRRVLRERLVLQMERLEQVGGALRTMATDDDAAWLAQLWSGLMLAANSASPPTLGRIEADVEGLLRAARERGALQGRHAALAQQLQQLAHGPDGVLTLRRQLLDLDNRTDALVVLTRTNADLLSEIVAADVQRLRDTTQTRSESVRRVLQSGQTGLLLLTALCLLVAAASALYGHRMVGQVENITGVMSRLAEGDTTQRTPAMARRDEIGALARTFEVFRDTLLAKQRLVAELREQGALLAAVHQSINDGLAVFDAQGRLQLWNPALQRLLARHGLRLQPGEPLQHLLPQLPADARWCLPGQAERLAFAPGSLPPLGAATHVEVHLPGNQVVELRSQPMPEGGLVSLVTDLTERRAIETQLQHALRLDMLGRLTGGVAHDFHNHLGTIVGTLGLLHGQPLDEAGRAQLARALRAAERATALTRRLLAFARRQPLQSEWVVVDAMVEEMADLIEYSAGTNVQVTLDLQSDDAAVLLDRGQLENALLNLVINSAAAMPEGGRLWVGTRRDRAPADAPAGTPDELVLQVKDTGCGIPEALQEQVFEPFFTTKLAGDGRDGEGSGLGLSIVHGFVHQSGGRVLLSSQVGEGTTVTLRFPVADVRAHGAAPVLTVPSAAGEQTPAPNAAGLRVMLVDDDDAFRATVTEMLRELGAQVRAFATPEPALQALQEGPAPDVLLTDVRLAGGADGRVFAHQARQVRPGLPVGLMSGVPREALTAGGTALPGPFVLKPFDRAGLVRWLGELRVEG